RQASKPKYFFKTRQILWRRQEGKCLVCLDSIDNGENVQVHHKILKDVAALTILTICAYCIQTVIGKYIASEAN
ncbi:group II intron encoded reverse transcriptase domain protein, partial [Rickettsia hoogstraalii str. RCCE3]